MTGTRGTTATNYKREATLNKDPYMPSHRNHSAAMYDGDFLNSRHALKLNAIPIPTQDFQRKPVEGLDSEYKQ
jgi:hypothetical protein